MAYLLQTAARNHCTVI